MSEVFCHRPRRTNPVDNLPSDLRVRKVPSKQKIHSAVKRIRILFLVSLSPFYNGGSNLNNIQEIVEMTTNYTNMFSSFVYLDVFCLFSVSSRLRWGRALLEGTLARREASVLGCFGGSTTRVPFLLCLFKRTCFHGQIFEPRDVQYLSVRYSYTYNSIYNHNHFKLISIII